LNKAAERLIPIFVVLVVAMMVVPLPYYVLDLLLAANFSISIGMMLLTMYTREPLEFSVFPSLLLVMTLFRLALNVSATRLILLTGQPGRIIETFGQFVVGGNEVVGLVVFIILVIIQFMVITKGAERVAEVAARFTLDAMPGKQMSIDADMNAGLISEEEARKRRGDIEAEADFYGAMDGASKFVKGDAMAGLAVVALDLIGGFAIGMLQQGLPAAEAWHRYALLTVGQGLVSQLPALIISTATGITVSRTTSKENLGADVTAQLTASPTVLTTTGAALAVLGVLPGMPKLAFLLLGAFWILAGQAVARSQKDEELVKREEAFRKETEDMKKPEAAQSLVKVDPLEIEFGLALLPLADSAQGGDLMDRIVMVRRQLASELGILIPFVRVRDNFAGLGPNGYCINLRGVDIGSGDVYPDRLMAMEGPGVTRRIPGIPGKEPAFGLDIVWIAKDLRDEAESRGYTVIESSAVIATHLTEVLRKHSQFLLTRQETRRLLDLAKQEDASCIDDAVPGLLTVGEVQKVLQNLVREGIPIRDLVTIVENLADAARISKDVDYLTMRVREGLAGLITKELGLDKGPFPVATLDPSFEREIIESTKKGDRGSYVALGAERLSEMMKAISVGMSEIAAKARKPILLTSAASRSQVYEIASKIVPEIAVVAYEELDERANVEAAKVIRIDGARQRTEAQ
jgi:flagellar biosynthesis protein FlhA